MTDTSVDAPAPPKQGQVIASWGSELPTRLVDLGSGEASVTMWIDGKQKEVARVSYGTYAATSTVRWNRTGTLAVEQYKRDAWDTQFYTRIAQWLRGKA